MKQGDKVRHPVYGLGTVIQVIDENNIAIKFNKGGPMGFAKNATNDIGQLKKA